MKIEVDGSLTLEQLIELASHGQHLFNNGLEMTKFSIKDIQKRKMELKLLKFAKKEKYRITDLIKEQGYRSLFIEELLQFSYAFPDKQKQFDIFTLDCFCFGNHGKLFPCLGTGFFGTSRQIGLAYIDSSIEFSKTRFAVTKI